MFNMMWLVGASFGFAYTFYKQQSQLISHCEPPSTQSRIRGNYENKIRFFSPPEKVYEIFASSKNEDGSLVMTYKDVLRAITPYNYNELKSNEEINEYFENYKDRINSIFSYADPN